MLSSKTGSPRLLVTLLTKALSTGIQATMIVVAPSILQCRRRSVRNGGVDDAEDDDSRGPDDEVGDIIGEVLASEGGKKNNPIGGDTGSTKQIRTDTGRPLKGAGGTSYTNPTPSTALSTSFCLQSIRVVRIAAAG